MASSINFSKEQKDTKMNRVGRQVIRRISPILLYRPILPLYIFESRSLIIHRSIKFYSSTSDLNPLDDEIVRTKNFKNNAIKFYEYFNAMKFADLQGLIAEESKLKDTKKGNFNGLENVIQRLIRVRTKHGDDPWIIGESEVLTQVPAVRTKLQFTNTDTKTIVTIVTTLTFDEDFKIAMIYTDRLAEEPV